MTETQFLECPGTISTSTERSMVGSEEEKVARNVGSPRLGAQLRSSRQTEAYQIRIGTGETALRTKCWSCQHEDLSLNP